MCTLAAYVRTGAKNPLVIAANRDEFLGRATSPPADRGGSPRIYCGIDRVHGGTWLGVNEEGVVAALLNRRTTEPPNPDLKSRGILCIEALKASSAAEARRDLVKTAGARFNPFNLLVADAREAWVATSHLGRMRLEDLPPGLHLLTNLDVNDATCPRIARSTRMFSDLLGSGDNSLLPPESTVAALRQILSSHDTPLDPRDPLPGNSLCVHAGEYGTRSSTLLFLDDHNQWKMFHADGAPCENEFLEHRPFLE